MTTVDQRRLLYRWDLDKTYLRTEFDTVRDLVRVALEPAAKKQTVPGAGALLREVTDQPRREAQRTPRTHG